MNKHWIDRELIQNPFFVMLTTNVKLLKKELKRLKMGAEVDADLMFNRAHAACHFFESDNGKQIVIVTIKPRPDLDIKQIYSLLVHEAVHIFQAIKKDFGERKPSKEFEAYSIQTISQNLMFEYDRQTKRLKNGKS